MMPAPIGVDQVFTSGRQQKPPPTATRSSIKASSISGSMELNRWRQV